MFRHTHRDRQWQPPATQDEHDDAALCLNPLEALSDNDCPAWQADTAAGARREKLMRALRDLLAELG